MSKLRKVDLCDEFGPDFKLERFQCFNPELERAYYDFLYNKNVELRYKNKNLMEYINEQRDSLLESDTNEEFFKNFEKKERMSRLKMYFLRVAIPLAVTIMLIANDDFKIHEEKNIYNTYGLLKNYTEDSNNDGIDEINTSYLKYVDDYYKPTDDNFYKNSNIFYDLYDNDRVLDNISFIYAMDELNKDIIDIDGILYSKTGVITKIKYTVNNETKGISTTREFANEDEIKEYVKEVIDDENVSFSIDEYTLYKTRLLEDIPSVYKSKIDGHVSYKKPNMLIKLLKITK